MKIQPRLSALALAAAFVLASGSAALAAAPLTLERQQSAAEKIAPPFITLPGKTLCICQNFDSSSDTQMGWLNSFVLPTAPRTVNIVCTYPVFDLAGAFDKTEFCSLFTVVK